MELPWARRKDPGVTVVHSLDSNRAYVYDASIWSRGSTSVIESGRRK